jgi:DNA-binding CsgD family transcriptional regulator
MATRLESSIRSSCPAILGLSAFAGLLLFASNGVLSFKDMVPSSLLWQLFVGALCATTISGLATALVFRKRRMGYKPGAAIAMASSLAGFASCILVAVLNLPDIAWAFSGGILGVGLGVAGVHWGATLSDMREGEMIVAVAVSATAACLVKLLLLLLHGIPLICALALLLVTATGTPCLLRYGTRSPSPKDGPGASIGLRGVVERNWVLFFGMVLCLSVKALTWQLGVFNTPPAPLPGTATIWGTAVGGLVGSILILLLGWNGASQRLAKATPFAPLLCVFLIALAWMAGVWEQGFNLLGAVSSNLNAFVSNLPVGLASTVLASLLVVKLSAEVRNGSSPSLAFGLLVGASAGLFLLLTVLQAVLTEASIGVFELTLRLSYLLLAVFYMITMASRLAERRSDRPSEDDDRIRAFCAYYKLSKREANVFAYVLQGRNAPFIANAEFLSLNTVRTHMKNIFSKTEVHKRQELLDLFYGFQVEMRMCQKRGM